MAEMQCVCKNILPLIIITTSITLFCSLAIFMIFIIPIFIVLPIVSICIYVIKTTFKLNVVLNDCRKEKRYL